MRSGVSCPCASALHDLRLAIARCRTYSSIALAGSSMTAVPGKQARLVQPAHPLQRRQICVRSPPRLAGITIVPPDRIRSAQKTSPPSTKHSDPANGPAYGAPQRSVAGVDHLVILNRLLADAKLPDAHARPSRADRRNATRRDRNGRA